MASKSDKSSSSSEEGETEGASGGEQRPETTTMASKNISSKKKKGTPKQKKATKKVNDGALKKPIPGNPKKKYLNVWVLDNTDDGAHSPVQLQLKRSASFCDLIETAIQELLSDKEYEAEDLYVTYNGKGISSQDQVYDEASESKPFNINEYLVDVWVLDETDGETHPTKFQLKCSASICHLVETAIDYKLLSKDYGVEDLYVEYQDARISLQRKVGDENLQTSQSTPFHIYVWYVIPPEELATFFHPEWRSVTYLIVKYTCQNSSKLRYYRSGGDKHTEEQFIRDVKKGMFPEGSTFELYSNYTPCAGRWEPNKAPCCDALLDAFNDGALQALDIYAVHVHTKYADPKKKLRLLVKKGFTINALCGEKLEEIISLLPSDHHKTASREATCTASFRSRVQETSDLLEIFFKKATTST